MELETHMFIAKELAYVAEDEIDTLQAKASDVGKILNRLIQALRKPVKM